MFLRRLACALSGFAAQRAGNVAMLFALSAPLILLAAGVAIDYSHAVTERQRMQAALDASVLAGAQAVNSGSSSSTALTLAGNYFRSDVGAAGPTASFAFNSDGSLSGSSAYTMPTLFGAFTGADSLALNVSAKAAYVSSSASSANPVCILVLAPNASQSLLANSGANINAPACEIDVASTAGPAAIFNSGVSIKALETCVAGPNIINNGGVVSHLVTSCANPSNPFVGKLPQPSTTSCNYSNLYFNGGSVTLSPGVYCGWTNFNGAPTVTLTPGVYVIKNGGWNVNGGSWTGTGVTFYFADTSKIQFNSGMNMTLSAPATGTYAGILMFEPDGLGTSPFVFDDSQSESLSGLIYLPSRQVTFNSTSNLSSPQITAVVYSVIFDTVNWSLAPSSSWSISRSGSGSSSSAKLTLTD